MVRSGRRGRPGRLCAGPAAYCAAGLPPDSPHEHPAAERTCLARRTREAQSAMTLETAPGEVKLTNAKPLLPPSLARGRLTSSTSPNRPKTSTISAGHATSQSLVGQSANEHLHGRFWPEQGISGHQNLFKGSLDPQLVSLRRRPDRRGVTGAPRGPPPPH